MEDWAEIRRLYRSEGLGIKTIARRLGVARNTVRAALAAHEPPKYERRPVGSSVDGFEPAIRELLARFPDMPATVIAERVGWTGASSVLRGRVAVLRPLFRGSDPADRTTYAAGDARVVDQGRVWVDTAARVHRIHDLSDKHLANVIAVLRHKALTYFIGYSFAELQPAQQPVLAGHGGAPFG